MDFNFSEEQWMLLDTIAKMGEREGFAQLANEIDAKGEFPHELMDKYKDLGLLGMTLPEEYGGQGAESIDAVLAIEALAKYSPMIASPVFESCVGAVRVIDMFGTPAQKQAVLSGVCQGENSVSVCMTEPEAGSDLTGLSTKLTPDGSGYKLNGRKCFITGAGYASHYLVYVRFGDTPGYKGIGGVLIEKGRPGFSFGAQEEFMGLRGMPSCDLIFEDVEVSPDDLVIHEGDFKKLMMTFDIERCGNSAMCLGVAGGALEFARNYALEREAFGRPICEFQAIQFPIAEMAMKLDAARLLVYRAATGAGKGLPSIYEASLAKCFANEMVKEVTDKAMQILGGYGYSKQFPMERMLRDSRAWAVAGGTLEMLKITLASFQFGRRFDQRRSG